MLPSWPSKILKALLNAQRTHWLYKVLAQGDVIWPVHLTLSVKRADLSRMSSYEGVGPKVGLRGVTRDIKIAVVSPSTDRQEVGPTDGPPGSGRGVRLKTETQRWLSRDYKIRDPPQGIQRFMRLYI
jgi:hypothetical protein